MMVSIESIMTTGVLTVPPTATVRDAIRLIEDSDIRHLPVVDGQKKLLGIISDRDLREYRIPIMLEIEQFDEEGREQAADVLDTAVVDVMASDVIAVDSSESMASLIDAMVEYKVGAVPVVDQRTDELVGIVSYVDVLRYARELIDDED